MAKLLYQLRKFNYVPHASTARRTRCHPQPDYETTATAFYQAYAVSGPRIKTDIFLDTFTSFSLLTTRIGKLAFLC